MGAMIYNNNNNMIIFYQRSNPSFVIRIDDDYNIMCYSITIYTHSINHRYNNNV